MRLWSWCEELVDGCLVAVESQQSDPAWPLLSIPSPCPKAQAALNSDPASRVRGRVSLALGPRLCTQGPEVRDGPRWSPGCHFLVVGPDVVKYSHCASHRAPPAHLCPAPPPPPTHTHTHTHTHTDTHTRTHTYTHTHTHVHTHTYTHTHMHTLTCMPGGEEGLNTAVVPWRSGCIAAPGFISTVLSISFKSHKLLCSLQNPPPSPDDT